MLPAATQAEILRLAYAEHWSLSKIARHLGVQRASVRKVVRRRSVALTRAPARPRTTVVTPFRARGRAGTDRRDHLVRTASLALPLDPGPAYALHEVRGGTVKKDDRLPAGGTRMVRHHAGRAHHTGFGTHVSRAIPADEETPGVVARYMTRPPLTPERIVGGASSAQVIYRSEAVHPRHQANFRVFDPWTSSPRSAPTSPMLTRRPPSSTAGIRIGRGATAGSVGSSGRPAPRSQPPRGTLGRHWRLGDPGRA